MMVFKSNETDVNSGDLTITDSAVTINATDKGITVTDELLDH